MHDVADAMSVLLVCAWVFQLTFTTGKWQIADPAAIEAMVDQVLADNPKQLEQYRAGKTKLQGYFAGQVSYF